VIYLIFVSGL